VDNELEKISMNVLSKKHINVTNRYLKQKTVALTF